MRRRKPLKAHIKSKSSMDLLAKSDEEIFAIGKPFWENLVRSSNLKDYGGFTEIFQHKCCLVPMRLSLESSGLTMNLSLILMKLMNLLVH